MDMKNRILFGVKGEKIYYKIISARFPKGSKFYPSEGHFIMRKQEDKKKEVYLHFDAAPLGYLSIAAHGHADALSFILHIDGQQVLVDPGTYTYHDDPVWRKYFISTLAHNTVRINREDQAINGGPTLWVRHYKTKVEEWSSSQEIDHLIASHDGYNRLGIYHSREIDFDKIKMEIRIKDILFSNKKRSYFIEIPFHLHPKIRIENLGVSAFVLKTPSERSVEISTDRRMKSKVIKGRVSPEITGWYSGSFLQKEPAHTILASYVSGKREEIFYTIIKIN